MMVLNLTTNLVRTMTRAVMRKLSKRRKILKKEENCRKDDDDSKTTKRNYRLYKQLVIIKNLFIKYYLYLVFVLRCHNLKINAASDSCFASVVEPKSFEGYAKVDQVDYLADFDKLYSKMDNFDKFFKTEKVSYNMLKYISG